MGQAGIKLDAVVVEPSGEPRGSIIWLHGLGADGHDFEAIVPELGLSPSCGVRFVFPHAPHLPITINGGMRMRAWYDIRPGRQGFETDLAGVVHAAGLVRTLIEGEISKGIPVERILLAGFSQGGAVALHTALRYPKPLAGILALSTYLPGLNEIPDLDKELSEANKGTPVFLAHGIYDPLVPVQWGRDTGAYLEKLGHPVQWFDYKMEHSVCSQEIEDMAQWLKLRICP